MYFIHLVKSLEFIDRKMEIKCLREKEKKLYKNCNPYFYSSEYNEYILVVGRYRR